MLEYNAPFDASLTPYSTAKSNLPKNWLRPVVGTFEAVGIGEDLTDLTYADRGFALESTHTFLK